MRLWILSWSSLTMYELLLPLDSRDFMISFVKFGSHKWMSVLHEQMQLCFKYLDFLYFFCPIFEQILIQNWFTSLRCKYFLLFSQLLLVFLISNYLEWPSGIIQNESHISFDIQNEIWYSIHFLYIHFFTIHRPKKPLSSTKPSSSFFTDSSLFVFNCFLLKAILNKGKKEVNCWDSQRTKGLFGI